MSYLVRILFYPCCEGYGQLNDNFISSDTYVGQKKERNYKQIPRLNDRDALHTHPVELQWLEHLWNHKHMFRQEWFELMCVCRSARSGSIIKISS